MSKITASVIYIGGPRHPSHFIFERIRSLPSVCRPTVSLVGEGMDAGGVDPAVVKVEQGADGDGVSRWPRRPSRRREAAPCRGP